MANLFLHYAFDKWMDRTFPTIPFERYVDDAVVHCKSERQAQMVRAAIAERMGKVGLLLHPDKTKIVYCQDSNRRGSCKNTSFTFLGYTFRPRKAQAKDGRKFTSFLPAVSKDAAKRIGQVIREWRLHTRIGRTLGELADWINPIVRGWLLYYGRFYRTEMYVFLKRINTYLVRWARMKYRRLRSFKKVQAWWGEVCRRAPRLFAHWEWTRGFLPTGW